jgi:hypothetical protein
MPNAPDAAQSAMLSIALPSSLSDRRRLSAKAAAPVAARLQSRISTSSTDVTFLKRQFSNPKPLISIARQK